MKFIVALLAAFALAAPVWAQVADMVLENANIYTMDASQPKAEALAIKDGRILALGDDLSKFIGPATRRIDLNGLTVTPGFIDSHGHMRGLGELLDGLDLRNAKSIAEVAELVRQAAMKRPEGAWIAGRNWDQTNWGGKFPTADDLSKAAPNHPVYLTRVDGHAGWANRKAMELAGLSHDTEDPPGGRIVRDASGNPTGILIDRAQQIVQSKIPAPTYQDIVRMLERAARECARVGLTGVHDAGISGDELKAYRELLASHRLPLRIYAMIGGPGDLWKEYLGKGPEIGEWLTVRSIKLYADGALGSRGALLWQDYSDDPGNRGLAIMSEDEIAQVAEVAAIRGFQVCTHAIGDRANRNVLDAYAEVLGGENNKRFRIEHAQVISLPDFALFKKYSIIASMQPTHATSDMRWAEKRLGPDRVAGAYAWQRFLKQGTVVASGSDFPVEDPNPLWGFYATITRQDHNGQPPSGWMPSQKFTRQQALRSWTLDGAYAAFEENHKGSLSPGKYADLVVLSKDIMTVPPAEILKTKVLTTVVGGEIVHDERGESNR